MVSTGMRTLGAKAIAAALCANDTLETMDLSGNDFAKKRGATDDQKAVDYLVMGLEVKQELLEV